MSILACSASRLLLAAAMISLVACIDAPQLNGYVPTASGSNEPAAGSNEPSDAGGGASAAPHEHDGMILVPGVTLEVPSDVAPLNVEPQAKPGKQGGDNGDDGKGTGNGKPAPTTTQVAVPSFWMDALEVNVASYRSCIAAGACTPPATGAGCTLAAGLEAHPVNCVTAEQTRVFCTWSAKRLVRDDEWSAAAAGSTPRLYPWGSEAPAPERLNACGRECAASGMYRASDGHVRTAPVGSFPLGRTPDGADDLAGNVAEWVEGGPVAIARGGSYADVDPSSVMSMSMRAGATAGPTVGFRCAADR